MLITRRKVPLARASSPKYFPFNFLPCAQNRLALACWEREIKIGREKVLHCDESRSASCRKFTLKGAALISAHYLFSRECRSQRLRQKTQFESRDPRLVLIRVSGIKLWGNRDGNWICSLSSWLRTSCANFSSRSCIVTTNWFSFGAEIAFSFIEHDTNEYIVN
jgi:hypothetical protein